jgi:hypothetical protein
MTIDTLDDLLVGMKGGGYLQPVAVQSQGGNGVGVDLSSWRLLSYPLTPAIPGAAAILNASTPGALPLAPRSTGQDRILAEAGIQMQTVGNTLQIEDRLAHMGGLSGILTTAQTVGIDLHSNLGVSNLAERIGAADYSELEWYLEWYTATGATVATPTVQATFDDGNTGTVNIWNPSGGVALPASVTGGRRYKLLPSNGRFIRAISSLTLSASTGTAGNYGITVRRLRARVECIVANSIRVVDWSYLRAPLIRDQSCLSYALMPLNATSGIIAGNLLQAVR